MPRPGNVRRDHRRPRGNERSRGASGIGAGIRPGAHDRTRTTQSVPNHGCPGARLSRGLLAESRPAHAPVVSEIAGVERPHPRQRQPDRPSASPSFTAAPQRSTRSRVGRSRAGRARSRETALAVCGERAGRRGGLARRELTEWCRSESRARRLRNAHDAARASGWKSEHDRQPLLTHDCRAPAVDGSEQARVVSPGRSIADLSRGPRDDHARVVPRASPRRTRPRPRCRARTATLHTHDVVPSLSVGFHPRCAVGA